VAAWPVSAVGRDHAAGWLSRPPGRGSGRRH